MDGEPNKILVIHKQKKIISESVFESYTTSDLALREYLGIE